MAKKKQNLNWLIGIVIIVATFYFGYQFGFGSFAPSDESLAVIGITIDGEWTPEECATLAEGTYVSGSVSADDCEVRSNLFNSDQCVCLLR